MVSAMTAAAEAPALHRDETAVTKLVKDADGRVVGIEVKREGPRARSHQGREGRGAGYGRLSGQQPTC